MAYPGPAAASTSAVNGFYLGAADRDPDVGQVGVHVDRAVPRSVGLGVQVAVTPCRRAAPPSRSRSSSPSPFGASGHDDLGHPDRLGQPAAVQ